MALYEAAEQPSQCSLRLPDGYEVRLMYVAWPAAGDVLLHTVTDAILGALSLPDIGKRHDV